MYDSWIPAFAWDGRRPLVLHGRTSAYEVAALRRSWGSDEFPDVLKNHSAWACDLLQLYGTWLRPIVEFFLVDLNEKKVVHVAATRAPTEQWTAA